jgi:carbon starvation protein CstA
VFYGAMITEGIVALIWAAIGIAFYSRVGPLNEVMIANKGNAAFVVNDISNSLLGCYISAFSSFFPLTWIGRVRMITDNIKNLPFLYCTGLIFN